MHLFTKAALGANPEAVADDQHANHQLWVDRRTTCMAVERSDVAAYVREIEEAIDAAQQVVRRDVIFEIKGIEQLLLSTACSTHHRISPLSKASAQHTDFRRIFVLV